MTRFYFDYEMPESSCADEDGTELASLRAAEAEAISAAAEWMKDNAHAGCKLNVSVRDGTPAPVFVVTASITVTHRS